jgi:hypothetical protein
MFGGGAAAKGERLELKRKARMKRTALRGGSCPNIICNKR